MAITKIKLYDGKEEIFFDSLKHRYTKADGNEIVSVTKVLGILAKPALINWSANMAADSIKDAWSPGRSYDELEIQAIIETGRKAHYQKKVDAANVGTFIHHFVEQTIKGENPAMPVNELLQESCGKFLTWVAERKVKFLASEQVVYSKKHNFVGTLDFICKIEGKLYVGDLKTSSGIYPEYLIQTGAYRFARSEEFPKEDYVGQLIIRIGKDGQTEFKIIEGDENYHQLFQAFVEALELTREMEKVKLIK